MHVRVCRAVSLTPEEQQAVADYAIARLGHRYDLKNIVDLLRWLLPMPPVPERFRRRMIQLGSGDPTRAICSILVAQAFQSVRYPISAHRRAPPHPQPGLPGVYRRAAAHQVPQPVRPQRL